MSMVLSSICKRWIGRIRAAETHKYEAFGKQAEDAMRFYGTGDHRFQFRRDYSASSPGLAVHIDTSEPNLTFEASSNLVSNVVQVFLPVLYARDPYCTVTPRRPNVPQALVQQYQQMKMQAMLAAIMPPAMPGMPAPPQLGPAPTLSIGPGMPPPGGPPPMMPGMQPGQMPMGMPMPPPTLPAAEYVGNEPLTIGEVKDKLRAKLLEWYLNYVPKATNLREIARNAITETLIKGMGLLWVEATEREDGTILVGLTDVSVDHLLIDPDSEKVTDAGWVARRRREPTWQVEQKFGLEPGTLKSHRTSWESESEMAAESQFEEEWKRSSGETCDLTIYYEIYSRVGLGSKLKGSGDSNDEYNAFVGEILDQYGDNVYLAVAPGVDFPLNIDPALVDTEATPEIQQEIQARIEWPVPTYHDHLNPWPFAPLGFHSVPRSPWFSAHITPVMGLQKCYNWILSFLMGRARITSRNLIVVPKSLEEDVKQRILWGRDLELIEIEATHQGTLQQLVNFLNMPNVNGDIWKLLEILKAEFEEATGITELNAAGKSGTQMRSAEEANVKRQMLSIRPDDMANLVENWMGRAMSLVGFASRLLMHGQDVAPIFGEANTAPALGPMQMQIPQLGPFTQLWDELVATVDPSIALHEYDYGVESGSVRKQDIDQLVTDLNEFGALWVPQAIQLWVQTGDPTMINSYIAIWNKSRNNQFALYYPDRRMEMMQQQMMMAAAAGQHGPGGGPPQNGGKPPKGPPPDNQPPDGPPNGGPPPQPGPPQ